MDSRTDILNSCLKEFRNTPEANTLVYYRSRDSRLTFDERMAIIRSIEKSFSPLFLELKAESQSLSESDLIYCALVASGYSPVVIADCISISKDSLRMRKIRVKGKLSPAWNELLFPEQDVAGATKSGCGNCDDNVAQHTSGAGNTPILLHQNQLKAKVMETKKITFGQAIKSGFRNSFKFSGRASRTEFWYFILFYVLVFYTLGLIISFSIPFIFKASNHQLTPTVALVSTGILFVIMIIPLIGITVRRLHDRERSGIWIMAYLAPTGLALLFAIGSFLIFGSETTVTETVSYTDPAAQYNKYTDSEGDTIRIYPDYMPQVLSGKRFFYYKANGDSIVVEPSVFNTQSSTGSRPEIKNDQKLIYGTAGIMSLLAIIAIVGFVILIIMCALPGTEGPNLYGPDPNAVWADAQTDTPMI